MFIFNKIEQNSYYLLLLEPGLYLKLVNSQLNAIHSKLVIINDIYC